MTTQEVDLSTISKIVDMDFFNDPNEIPDIILGENEPLNMEFENFDFLNSPVDLSEIAVNSVGTSEDSVDNILSANSNEDDLDNIEFTSGSYEDFEVERVSKSFRSTKRQTKVEIGYLNNEDLDHGMPGQKLFLTSEEKSLLSKSGHKIPSHLPLTKTEDRALRTVRRKIRNKLSAKASRARRQKYLCGLEDQINYCNRENIDLKKKVFQLEQDKKSLISYVRRLRTFISSYIPDGVNSMSKLPSIGKRTLQKTADNHSLLPFYHQKTTKNVPKSYVKPAAGGTSLLVAVFIILAWTAVVPLSEETKILPEEQIYDSMPSRILLSTKQKLTPGPQIESYYQQEKRKNHSRTNHDYEKSDENYKKVNSTRQEQAAKSTLPHIKLEKHHIVPEIMISV